MHQSKHPIRGGLDSKLLKFKGVKVKLSYNGLFYKSPLNHIDDQDIQAESIDKNFRTNVYKIVFSADIGESVANAISAIGEEINSFIQLKSGWNFYKNIKLDINMFRYTPLRGHSYLTLPSMIANKKACINVKNKDEKCFLYSVVAQEKPTHEGPTKSHKVQKPCSEI